MSALATVTAAVILFAYCAAAVALVYVAVTAPDYVRARRARRVAHKPLDPPETHGYLSRRPHNRGTYRGKPS